MNNQESITTSEELIRLEDEIIELKNEIRMFDLIISKNQQTK